MCAGDCACLRCSHTKYTRARSCSLSACGKPSRLRIVAWSPVEQRLRTDRDDPEYRGEFENIGSVAHDKWSQYACGNAHAREIIRMVSSRAPIETTSGEGWVQRPTYYRIEPFRYTPDRVDLYGMFGSAQGSVLGQLADTARTIRVVSDDLIRDVWHGESAERPGQPIRNVGKTYEWRALREATAKLLRLVDSLDADVLTRRFDDGEQ